MNPEFHDLIMYEYYDYPEGMISQFVPEQGAAEEVKGRRRRRKREGGGGELMRKRKLSEEQVSMLERSFGSEHKLECERKERLAAELGLDPRQVAVWFQNRRARWKAKKMEEDFSTLRSQLHSTLLEKCRLESEVVKMKAALSEAEKEIDRLVWEGLRSINSPATAPSPHFLGFEWDHYIYYNM